MMTSHGSRRRPIILKDESNKNNIEKFSNAIESPRNQFMNVSRDLNHLCRILSRFLILTAFVRARKIWLVQLACHQPKWQGTSTQLASRACLLTKMDLLWNKTRKQKKLRLKISSPKLHSQRPRSLTRNVSWLLITKEKWGTQTKFIFKEAWSAVQGCTNSRFRLINVCPPLSKL